MLKRYLNRRSWRIFGILFVCITLLAGSIAGIVLYSNAQQLRQGYLTQLQVDMQRMGGLYEQMFQAAYNTASANFQSRWYKHYRNISGYYDAEFDALKRNEITASVQTSVNALPFVSDILIITPSRDSIICRSGWYSIPFYQAAFGELRFEKNQKQELEVFSERYSVTTIQDPNIRYQPSIIAILWKKDALKQSLQSMQSADTAYVHLKMNGEDVAECGQREARMAYATYEGKLPSFTLEIGYPPVYRMLMNSLGTVGLLTFLVILFLSFLLSFITAMLFTKPLTDIIISVGGSQTERDDPFSFLYAYLETFSREHERLHQENHGMQESQKRLLHLLENEVLCSMLTNPEFDYSHPGVASLVPWFQEHCCLYLAVFIPKYASVQLQNDPRYPALETAADRFAHARLNEEDVLFFGFDPANETAGAAAIQQLMHNMNHFHVVLSSAIQTPAHLNDTYLRCKRLLVQMQTSWMEIPISVEVHLHNALHSGKMEECLEILSSAREQFAPDTFVQLVGRVTVEYNIPMDSWLTRYRMSASRGEVNQQWAILEEWISELCRRLALERQTGGYNQIASICSYVDKHYADPDLCIDQIAQQFSLHPTLVSKRFKAYTDKTFSEYLQELRMNAALESMKNSRRGISEIAEAVGYGNYQTFMRAFKRHTGMSPMEYRMSVQKDD